MPVRFEKHRKKPYVVDLRSKGYGQKHFATKREANNYLKSIETEIARRGDWTDPAKTPTYEQAIIEYLKHEEQKAKQGQQGLEHVENKRAALTQMAGFNYDGRKLAGVRVGDLRLGIIKRDLMSELFSKNAHKTADNKFVIFKNFCQYLLEGEIIVSNPAFIKKPLRNTASEKELERITEEDMRNIIACADEEFQLAIKFAAYTGVRAGEQKALTWNDIDFTNCLVNINKAHKRLTGVGAPKTARSKRKIEIDALVDELREWKLKQPMEQRRLNLVFPNQSGGYASTDRWRKIGLQRACKKAEVTNIRWHDLRHYFASVLIFVLKESDAVITRLMGHHSIAFTESQYGNWIKEARRDLHLGKRIGQAMAGGV